MNNRSYLIATTILILIIGVGAWFLVGRKIEKPPQPPQAPTAEITEPKILSLEATKLKRNLTREAEKTGELVLETNSDLEIKYIIAKDQFLVTVKRESFAEIKQLAEQWFLDKGFIAEDLCLLKITLTISEQVKSNLSAADFSLTGCPATPSP